MKNTARLVTTKFAAGRTSSLASPVPAPALYRLRFYKNNKIVRGFTLKFKNKDDANLYYEMFSEGLLK